MEWRIKRDSTQSSPNEKGPSTPYQQRGSESLDWRNSKGYSPRSSNGRSSLTRDSLRKPLNDSKAEQAIEEGRRVYVGNMTYEATVKDIEALFADVASGIEAINMSVDPMTGRNPSYCFIDFASKELADRVMTKYDGRDFMRRPLKVRPGVKSGTGTGRYDMPPRQHGSNNAGDQSPSAKRSPAFDRWRRLEPPEHFNTAPQEGRRLYVGGLPRFPDQETTDEKIRALFKDVNIDIDIVSKLISPHESKKNDPGNHYYCFVDLSSENDIYRAIHSLDNLDKWNWNIKVSKANGTSGKLNERKRLYVGGLPSFDDHKTMETEIRELFQGFDIKTISKLFPPNELRKNEEGNHHYCFVELVDGQQADSAIEALDWKEKWDWKIRVKPATGNAKGPEKPAPRGWGPSKEVQI
ncbi:hypothetical protein F5884DRAFT_460712 [Xylogone sp. PMI_703]|nr:hypothetical protein F5884DRAFT_460712 [Xylogone sp. PMI_703]